MSRLTRADQQARTQADLLATARREFLANGYFATSLESVAEAAGYSKGAVYSNFRDKPHLCRAVLEDVHRDKLGELAQVATGDGDLEQRLDAVADWIRRTVGDVEWTMLEMEFATLTRRDSELRDMVVTLRDEAAAGVTTMLQRMLADAAGDDSGNLDVDRSAGIEVLDDPDSTDSPTLADIADLLLSTGIGLGITRAVDPTISVEPAISGLRAAMALLSATTFAR